MSDEASRRAIERLARKRHDRARVEAVAADASTRRFWRILHDTGSEIVIDYDEPLELPQIDVVVTDLFREAGLPVAAVLELVQDDGLICVEDLGDLQLADVLADNAVGDELPAPLVAAVELAARIGREGTPVLARSSRAAGPALDASRFRFEMDYFIAHFVGDWLELDGEALRAPLGELAARAADAPRVLCHRDYHSRNLMVGLDGALAMVDIQDARWGPDGYDLASILYDAYIELDPAWIGPLTERFRELGVDSVREAAFDERLRAVATERTVKALGTFGFQVSRRGAERFLPAIERTIGRLRGLLAGSELRPALEPYLDAAAARFAD